MNLHKTLSLGVLALAAVLIAAAPANAQQMIKGTFNLPFEAQIGSTIVEPGQYDITLEESLGQKLVRLRPELTSFPKSFAISRLGLHNDFIFC